MCPTSSPGTHITIIEPSRMHTHHLRCQHFKIGCLLSSNLIQRGVIFQKLRTYGDTHGDTLE